MAVVVEHGYISADSIVSLCGNVIDRTPNKPESTPKAADEAGVDLCPDCIATFRGIRQAAGR